MSKIEKALNRAGNANNRAMVPSTSSSVDPTEAANLTDPATEGAAVAAGASSSDTIPLMRETALRAKTDLAQRRIIYPDMPEDGTAHAFRDLRTRILQRTQGRNAIVLVTPVTGDSGNSFVAQNLAVAFAFDSDRTALLVDCNLKSPALHTLIKAQRPIGITDYVDDPKLDIGPIIHPTGIERLRVIPAGTKRDLRAEYFTSDRIRHLMESIRQRYADRFVIVDAPSMSESADTRILADLSDHVLLVVPYGRTPMAAVDTCMKSIDGGKFLGVVFNNEPCPALLDRGDKSSRSSES